VPDKLVPALPLSSSFPVPCSLLHLKCCCLLTKSEHPRRFSFRLPILTLTTRNGFVFLEVMTVGFFITLGRLVHGRGRGGLTPGQAPGRDLGTGAALSCASQGEERFSGFVEVRVYLVGGKLAR
jgi:hypothetical protein